MTSGWTARFWLCWCLGTYDQSWTHLNQWASNGLSSLCQDMLWMWVGAFPNHRPHHQWCVPSWKSKRKSQPSLVVFAPQSRGPQKTKNKIHLLDLVMLVSATKKSQAQFVTTKHQSSQAVETMTITQGAIVPMVRSVLYGNTLGNCCWLDPWMCLDGAVPRIEKIHWTCPDEPWPQKRYV